MFLINISTCMVTLLQGRCSFQQLVEFIVLHGNTALLLAMISVELWRARIGLFNTKCFSRFLSSLFSSYVPFKFRCGRCKRPCSTSNLANPQEELPTIRHVSHLSNTPEETPAVSSLQQSLLSRSWSSFLPTSFPRGLLSGCLLREALVRLVLLLAIISQVLIISGDVETNPCPDPSEC